MQLGMLGLGRMGANMARRLLKGGHEVVVWNRTSDKVDELKKDGAKGSSDLDEFVKMLSKPRTAWVMLPSGDITEKMVHELAARFEPGDIIIDGGNSKYTDDVRRAQEFSAKGIHYMDVGTSGGIWGLERGYCLMIGGTDEGAKTLDPVFATLAPGIGNIDKTPGREPYNPTAEQGYLHCGPAGSGHFVKMVHNGIEYGIMQAFAEGFEIFKNQTADEVPQELRFDLSLVDIAEVWRRGSVVSSWLLDLTAAALAEAPTLNEYSGFVQDSGEGRWTIEAAIQSATPADVLSASLYARFRSRQKTSFANQMLSAMRAGFGGHKEPGQHKESASNG